ncbi:MAG: hypothetical protein IJ326_08520 [Lachnospiraceae bacterium]|nr:hypothetical protein [Lachnospiraceae bacterium]
MVNLILFLRELLSYLLLFGVIVVVAAAGAFVGLKVWKPKKSVKDNNSNQ